MPTGRLCGNCKNFSRIKSFSFKNGLCDIDDSNCYSDSSFANIVNII